MTRFEIIKDDETLEEFAERLECSKQETIEEAVELFFRKKDAKNCTLYKAAKFGAKWQQEQYSTEEKHIGHTINEFDKTYIKGFNDGSKWQQERSYSEEEVLKTLLDIELVNPVHLTMIKSGYGEFPDTYELTQKGVDYIIEQFKKK